MKLHFEVSAALNAYFVTRDEAHLHQAMADIQAEIDDPVLQESILTLDNLTAKQIEKIIGEVGYLRISTQEVTNSEGIPVETDKYIRVMYLGADDQASIILKVAAITNDFLVLVPYTPGSGLDGSLEASDENV